MWHECERCNVEYQFAHKCLDGTIAKHNGHRELELGKYHAQLDVIKQQMTEDASDDSYRPVSWGVLRLLLWHLERKSGY